MRARRLGPDEPGSELVCTDRGSDTGGRESDVVVGGTETATEELDRESPGEFFVRSSPLSTGLVRGKEAVR